MEETIIRRITAVKYLDSIIPTERPFCATISATSPLVIMPTPIFRESTLLKRRSLDVRPHPITLVINAIATNRMQNKRSDADIWSMEVFSPILQKNMGANSM